MKRHKLQTYLFALVIVSGVLSMTLMSLFVIDRSHKTAEDKVQHAITVVHERFGWQLLRVENRLDPPGRFPDFGLWQRSGHFDGLCIQYTSFQGYASRGWCNGAADEQNWPKWFESFYRYLQPEPLLYRRALEHNDDTFGEVEVSLDPATELQQAWDNTQHLLMFMLISICLTCVLLLLLLRRLLSTLDATHRGLATMVEGQLNHRIPSSRVQEWHNLNQGINNLAEQLDHTLEQRNQLLIKMLNLQDSERRHVCRELHDELGQALTGLSAVTQSLSQSPEPMAAASQEKLLQIQDINRHLKTSLQRLLLDLRPGLLDEMSLKESLNKLVLQWNQQQDQVFFELFYQAPTTPMPPAITDNVFRITQECLTNTFKHSGAGYAAISLSEVNAPAPGWCLSIIDDGAIALKSLSRESVKQESLRQTSSRPENDHTGQGLLGIQERVTLMNGELNTQQSELGGLALRVFIPIASHRAAS